MKVISMITILLASAVGFAQESQASDVDVNEQYSKAKEISVEQAQSPEGVEYLGTMAKPLYSKEPGCWASFFALLPRT